MQKSSISLYILQDNLYQSFSRATAQKEGENFPRKSQIQLERYMRMDFLLEGNVHEDRLVINHI